MLEHHHRELLNFLRGQMHDRELAADLAQESVLRVLGVQATGRTIQDWRALLFRTARHLMVDLHRRSRLRRHEVLHQVPELEQPAAPRHLQPEEIHAGTQTLQAYLATIAALPPRCREAFEAHVFEGLAAAEIAARMGISVSMVEKHLARGLLSCRQCERRLAGDRPGG